MTISLACLSPALVKAALNGHLPRGIGVTRLCVMPAEWSEQHKMLGLTLYPTVHAAGTTQGLAALNLIVWAKTNAGMGSLYRSQHELFALYKKGAADHVNNIELGKNGRWRSNVWKYPGASSVGSDSRKGLQFHPTVKPEAMCADAILDLTNRGDIVLDPFLGSGSTLIAAHRVKRRCFAIELDPLYVDVTIRRFQEVYGHAVTLEATGETFDAITQKRIAGIKDV